jgi:Ca2+-binding RTX toxin-like protein
MESQRLECKADPLEPRRLLASFGPDLRFGDEGVVPVAGDVAIQSLPGGQLLVIGTERIPPTPPDIFGDPGDDTVKAGLGDDRVSGGAGRDHLFGQQGHDRVSGTNHSDALDGGPDDDTLIGLDGHDKLFGGDGDDLVLAADGLRDSIFAGDGNDSGEVDAALDLPDALETIL